MKMNLTSQEEDMPIPINTTYSEVHGHGHMIHHEPAPHHNIVPSSAVVVPQNPPNDPIPTALGDLVPYKKMVRYKECLKNHAASMGGNATDGCGEFMPSGGEGTLEALTCSACNCHRNFHRREIEGGPPCPSPFDYYHHHSPHLTRVGRKGGIILGHHRGILGPDGLGYPRAAPAHQMIMSYNMGSLHLSESDEQEEGGGVSGGGGGVVARPAQLVKKRFRTKFSQEQKEKMLNFAEKVGWKIQKQEESVVQQFCQEVGIKRRVLKVWMHNNKHNLAKKNPSTSPNQI